MVGPQPRLRDATVKASTDRGATRKSAGMGAYHEHEQRPESGDCNGYIRYRSDPRCTAMPSLLSSKTHWTARPVLPTVVEEDLCSLRDAVDCGEEFCDDVDGRWRRLVCRTPEAERFRRFDVSVTCRVCQLARQHIVPYREDHPRPRRQQGRDEGAEHPRQDETTHTPSSSWRRLMREKARLNRWTSVTLSKARCFHQYAHVHLTSIKQFSMRWDDR